MAPSHGNTRRREWIAGSAGPDRGQVSGEGRVMDRFRSRRAGRPVQAGLGLSLRTIAILAGLVGVAQLSRPVAGAGPPSERARGSTRPTATTRSASSATRPITRRDRQWSEAVDIYQRVIDRYGDKVAKVPRGEPGTDPASEFVLYMDGRRYCHRCIAQMPPEAREIYRSRVDQLAGRWYRPGAARRDVGMLRRVVDQAFCSSWGDDALELLGDLAFQDGRFGDAVSFYGQLVAGPGRRSVLAGASRSVGRPGAGRRQEMAVPGGIRQSAGPRRPRGVRAAISRRAGKPGRPHRQLRDDPGRRRSPSDRLENPGQPDGRWPTFAGLAATDAGRPRADRRRPGPVAGRPREGLDHAVRGSVNSGPCRARGRRPAGARACWPSTRS